MPEPAVVARQLTKVYKVYASPWDRLREALLRRPRHREFRALADVSFSLPKGEGLAIIGENGAGKSTLLKLLAGIGAATSGSVAVEGKVASTLELGSGFHPEFTGRQNVVLNAAMLGLSEPELRQKLPAIVEWSELGEFIDQPVKVYSTGMAMRLGFSIAIQVEPDVLIIDEALSVGDGYFQKKCMDRLLQFVGSGGTLLFCSHAMYYASAFCRRALWLRQGRAEALGPVADVVRDYENYLLAKSSRAASVPAAEIGGETAAASASAAAAAAAAAGIEAAVASEDLPRRPARLLGVRVGGGAAAEAPAGAVPLFAPGDALELEVEWESHRPELAFHVGIGINRIDDLEVCSLATHLDGRQPMTGGTRYRLGVVLPRLALVKGEFTLYVFLLDESGLHIYDQRIYRRAFGVHGAGYVFGLVALDHRWQEPAGRSAPLPGPQAPGAPLTPVDEAAGAPATAVLQRTAGRT
jgi:lipopolysaccharide transport system ATP-binding protein